MLPKNRRLKKNEIAYILKKGGTRTSRLFIVKETPKREENPRYCVIISRKMSTKAVERNLLRRRINEAIRNNMENVKNPQLDMVLIPKKRALNKQFDEIEEDIIHIINGSIK